MAQTIEVKVPDIGDFTDVPVIEVLVKAGDHVDAEAPLITLESDKATMEVPAPQAGTVRAVRVKEGDKVSEGSVVLTLETGAAAAPANPVETQTKAEAAAEAAAPAAAVKSAPAKSSGAARSVEVKVPDIGDFTDVPVIEVLVKDGDVVEKDAALVTLESDKATMEVPAPQAGTVRGVKLKEGDKVSEGRLVCSLDIDGEMDDRPDAVEPPAPAHATEAAPAPSSPPVDSTATPRPAPPDAGDTPAHASPSVRKFARELGVDLAPLKGSGPHGRILREDVQGHVKQSLSRPGGVSGGAALPAIPPVDFAQFGAVETKPLARIRKLSAAHLHRSWLNLPHVTQTDEADITELEAFRHGQNSKRGVKLTLLPFILKAVARAIDSYPEFAASLDATGDNLVMKQYRHIGFAADTPNGLLVPVVRDVDRKGIVQLAKETGELAGKARDGKLKPDEMKGGVFSVSSLGGIGGGFFTPIVNAPEVGILGVSRAVMKPVWDGQAFQPRLLLPLSLSYDHRVIDGAYAARFIVQLGSLLSDLRRLLL